MVAATMCGVIVDREFQSQIPPLTDEERNGLEENLLRDGCLEPLIAWAEHGILLDGHNRKEICERYGIDYEIREVSLPDRHAASDWIDAHQLGRRNLTPEQMSLLRGRRYNRLKKTKAEAGAKGGASKDQNDTCLPDSTSERLAKEHGVSAPTIKRDGQYADCLPGRIAFTDIDAIVEINGNLLLMEWKDHRSVCVGQRILFERLTRFCPATVLIVKGDAESMAVESVAVAWAGHIGPPHPTDLDGLRRMVQGWAKWAMDNPATRQPQEAVCA